MKKTRTKNRFHTLFMGALLLIFCSTLIAACGNQGPEEEVGKKVDAAFDAAKKKLEEATR